MKGTKVLTLGAPLIDGMGHTTQSTSHRLASCVIVSRFRTALDLDTDPLSNFIRPRCAERAKRGRGIPVSQCSLCILAF